MGEVMKSIAEIPHPYRQVFSNYESFNEIQSECFDDVFYTNKSIIISAPTGSGKTVIFELAIVRLIFLGKSDALPSDIKAIYVAPTKALCSEKYLDWSNKFNQFGCHCLEVTGDSEITEFSELSEANLIVTTPEKWDSLTRKWKDNEDIVRSIRLFMIDEVHLLNEDVRGPILEAIVSRMKTIQLSLETYGQLQIDLRFVAVSATIPNIKCLVDWIEKRNPEKISDFQFSEEKRPVKLEKHVIGFNTALSSFKFDISLNYKLTPIIRKFAGGKPTLIFCSSRKAVEMASAVLEKESSMFPLSDNHKTALYNLSNRIKDSKLQPLFRKGIAYHHAGLTYEDRNVIEDAFRNCLLLILVSTNTLAMGVNLPAHLVIVKSTDFFANGQTIQYSESAVLQMIGRAGRPQYDLSGVVVIMTQQKNVHKYQNLMNGCTPIESHLHKHLAEHLNSEIVLQTITDLDIAMQWIRSTFLYVRACKMPKNYGFNAPGMTKDNIEKKLEELCLVQINLLEANGLITREQKFGQSIRATSFGRLMARYYISFDSMKLFRQIRGNESFLETFNLMVRCKEFSEFTLRVNDKKLLNELNNKPVRFPIRGKIKTNDNKVSCLIQSNFDNLQISDPSMIQDSLKMLRIGERLSKCFFEFVRLFVKTHTNSDGVYRILCHSIVLMKCFKAKLWENSQYVSKQLNKIGTVYSRALVNAGKTTFKSILETDTQSLEMILNKPPPFGSEIHEAVAGFPNYELQMQVDKLGKCVDIFVHQTNDRHRSNGFRCYLIAGDSDNNLILFNDQIATHIQEESNRFYKRVPLPKLDVESITANLIHESLVGVDKTVQIVLNPVDRSDENPTKKVSKRKVQSRLKTATVKRDSRPKEYPTYGAGTSTGAESAIELLDDDEDLFININSQTMDDNHQSLKSDYDTSIEVNDAWPAAKKCKPNFVKLVNSYEFSQKPKLTYKNPDKKETIKYASTKTTDPVLVHDSFELSKIFDEDFFKNDEIANKTSEFDELNEHLQYDEYLDLSNDIIWNKVDEKLPSNANKNLTKKENLTKPQTLKSFNQHEKKTANLNSEGQKCKMQNFGYRSSCNMQAAPKIIHANDRDDEIYQESSDCPLNLSTKRPVAEDLSFKNQNEIRNPKKCKVDIENYPKTKPGFRNCVDLPSFEREFCMPEQQEPLDLNDISKKDRESEHLRSNHSFLFPDDRRLVSDRLAFEGNNFSSNFFFNTGISVQNSKTANDDFPRPNNYENFFFKNHAPRDSISPENQLESWNFHKKNIPGIATNHSKYGSNILQKSSALNKNDLASRIQQSSVKRMGLPKPTFNYQSYNIAKPTNIFGGHVGAPKSNPKSAFMSARDLFTTRNRDDGTAIPRGHEHKREKTERVSKRKFFSDALDPNVDQTKKRQCKDPFELLFSTPVRKLSQDLENDRMQRTPKGQFNYASLNQKNENNYAKPDYQNRCGMLGNRRKENDTDNSGDCDNHLKRSSESQKDDQQSDMFNQSQKKIKLGTQSVEDNIIPSNQKEVEVPEKDLQLPDIDLSLFDNPYTKRIQEFVPQLTNIDLLKSMVEGHINHDIVNLTDVDDIKINCESENEDPKRSRMKSQFFEENEINHGSVRSVPKPVPTVDNDSVEEHFLKLQKLNSSLYASRIQSNASKSDDIDIFEQYFPNYDREKTPLQINLDVRPNPHRLQLQPRTEGFSIRKPIYKGDEVMQKRSGHGIATDGYTGLTSHNNSYRHSSFEASENQNLKCWDRRQNNEFDQNDSNFLSFLQNMNNRIMPPAEFDYANTMLYHQNVDLGCDQLIEPKIEIDFDSEETVNALTSSPNAFNMHFSNNGNNAETKYELDFDSEESKASTNYWNLNDSQIAATNANGLMKKQIANNIKTSINFSQFLPF